MKIRDFDIQALPNDPEVLKGVIIDMKHQLDYFLEQLNLAKARQFAASSEKSPDQFDLLFNEAESLADAESDAQEAAQTERPQSAKKRGRKPLPAALKRTEVIHDITDAEKICACCNGALHKMGEERSEQLEFIPASLEVRVNVRPKYACRHCEKVGVASQIKIAALPFNPIPKSIATPRLLAYIIAAKFQFSLPLYRQEAVFQQYGIELSRQTLANWMMKSFDYFEPFIRRLKIHLLDQKSIHADETTCQVLNEDRQQCYMWIYCSGADSPQSSVHKNIVLYDYQPTRAGAGPRNYLSEYEGYVHVDGYAAYEQLPNVSLVGCWAHARRKFVEAQKAIQSAGKLKQKTGKADWAISHIQKLYRIETSLKGQPEQAIYHARQTQSRPLVEQFKAWLDSSANSVLPESALGKAVQYCLNQWHKLERYLESGLLSIDNNRAERAAKSFVIGRKNWMFSNTARGARASAGLYSLVETAKVNGLDPTKYLERLFNELHRCKTDAEMDTLLPWVIRL
jgi:transposase